MAFVEGSRHLNNDFLDNYILGSRQHFKGADREHYVWHDTKNILFYPYALARHAYPDLMKVCSQQLNEPDPLRRFGAMKTILEKATGLTPDSDDWSRRVPRDLGIIQQTQALLKMFPVFVRSILFLDGPTRARFSLLQNQQVDLQTVMLAAGIDPHSVIASKSVQGSGPLGIIVFNMATNAAKAHREIVDYPSHLVPVPVTIDDQIVKIVNQSDIPLYEEDIRGRSLFPENSAVNGIGTSIAIAYEGMTGVKISWASQSDERGGYRVSTTIRC